jgi:glycosidase
LEPETYIVGEYWGDSLPWIVGNAWDGSMNYPLGNAIIGFWLDTSFSDTNHKAGWYPGPIEPLLPSQLDRHIQSFLEKYPPMSVYAMMNILGSHDTNRLLFMLDPNTSYMNPNLYKLPDYPWDFAIRRLVAAVSLQMSLPGAPSVFYGDEVVLFVFGLFLFESSYISRDLLVYLESWMALGRGESCCDKHFDFVYKYLFLYSSDPANRMPFPWLDESGTPFYLHLKNEEAMQAVSSRIKLAIQARNEHSCLRNGSFHTVLIQDSQGIYCFLRHDFVTGDCALIALRKTYSTDIIRCSLNTLQQGLACILPNTKWKNILHSTPNVIQVDEDGTLTLELESVSVAIFVRIL